MLNRAKCPKVKYPGAMKSGGSWGKWGADGGAIFFLTDWFFLGFQQFWQMELDLKILYRNFLSLEWNWAEKCYQMSCDLVKVKEGHSHSIKPQKYWVCCVKS